MARPRRKGRAVSFRLPIDLTHRFDAEARRRGVSRSVLAEQVVTEHLENRGLS